MLEKDEDHRSVVMNRRCNHPKSITLLEKRMEEFEVFIFRSRGILEQAVPRRPAAFSEEHVINLQQKLEQRRGSSFLPRKTRIKGRMRGDHPPRVPIHPLAAMADHAASGSIITADDLAVPLLASD